jgi:ankyrin repeat protein
MDAKFHPAIQAIKSGDLERLRALITKDPALAIDRSTKSHPTLLQGLVLDGRNLANQVEMVRVLVKAGAEINGPLVACAGINNVAAAAELLDCGAQINGPADWSPLEEALYWGNREMIEFLIDRGASVHNLRIAAGLGRVDLIENFFDQHGNLKPDAGDIHWPFSDPLTSTSAIDIQGESGGHSSPQDVINNAFLYACMHGQQQAAEVLLGKGAEINAIPH